MRQPSECTEPLHGLQLHGAAHAMLHAIISKSLHLCACHLLQLGCSFFQALASEYETGEYRASGVEEWFRPLSSREGSRLGAQGGLDVTSASGGGLRGSGSAPYVARAVLIDMEPKVCVIVSFLVGCMLRASSCRSCLSRPLRAAMHTHASYHARHMPSCHAMCQPEVSQRAGG